MPHVRDAIVDRRIAVTFAVTLANKIGSSLVSFLSACLWLWSVHDWLYDRGEYQFDSCASSFFLSVIYCIRYYFYDGRENTFRILFSTAE